MSRVKQKNAFQHAQNAQIQIFRHMRKAPSGPLLSILLYPMFLLVGSESPDQTARMYRVI